MNSGTSNDAATMCGPLELTLTKAHRDMVPQTLLVKTKLKQGNTCANVYTQGKFTKVTSMTSRVDAGKSLIKFTDDVGIPNMLITDAATEFTGKNTEFVKGAHCMCTLLHTTEQGHKNQNHAAK